MTQDRVMLLIDADNVSVDVMEQAVRLLLNQHGALHVRRAYCTAESALANQAAFKRLGIKPMVNLAAGKNSTDIAMAVDAIDLVLAERPDVVVIASSDSDFAPLVQRLREKGCVVRGIGQQGKTGDETQEVYDDFTVLEHRKAAGAPAAPARKTARKTAAKPAARKVAAKKVAAKSAAAKAPRKTAARKSARAADVEAASAALQAVPQAAPPPPAPAPAAPTPAPAPVHDARPARPARDGGASRAGRAQARPERSMASVQAVLACLPELAAGQGLALNVAVQRLREAQLLGKNSSSLKLFSQMDDQFELLPADKPSQVRLRR
jgi:uncharacterized protein (TIGR00288 family)